jgi:glycosyltransferase involved in cell wall biosynthesis
MVAASHALGRIHGATLIGMRVLHLVSNFDKQPSGINQAVVSMMRSATSLGVEAGVCSTTRDPLMNVANRALVGRWPLCRQWDYAPDLLTRAETQIQEVDLIHAHNLWLYPTCAAWRLASKYEKPWVLSLHGMLEPERLRESAFRKRALLRLYAARMLKDADRVLVTSDQEAASLRTLFPGVASNVVPLGVEAPSYETSIADRGAGLRRCLFLSRITPIKGLDLLVQAVDRLRPEGWVFDLVGPEEEGHGEQLRALIGERGLEAWFRFLGPVSGDAKWATLRSADLLVLPSRNENFALVVAEALAMQCPVLTTDRTPWSMLESEGCGWQVPATVDGIVTGLSSALATSRGQLQAMGAKGRDLYQTHFTETAMANSLVEVYRTVVEGAEEN